MGRLKSDQGQLFYEFHLSDAVPEDHLVKKIDAALDLSWLRSELAPHYSSMAILGVGECGHRPVRLEARVQIGQRLCRFPSRHYNLGSSIDLYQRRHEKFTEAGT